MHAYPPDAFSGAVCARRAPHLGALPVLRVFCQAHAALFVRQVHRLEGMPDVRDAHLLNGHPVWRVEVVATVVSIKHSGGKRACRVWLVLYVCMCMRACLLLPVGM